VSLGRQTLRRAVNERILHRVDLHGVDLVDLFCECGGVRCAVRISVPKRFYEEILGQPGSFVVSDGHEQLDGESLVSRGDGWALVAREAI
jgi:hypothetical protein